MSEELVLFELPEDPRLTGFGEGFSSAVRSRPLVPQDATAALQELVREKALRRRAESLVAVLMEHLGVTSFDINEKDIVAASRSRVVITVVEGSFPSVHLHYTREEASVGQRQGRQERVRLQEPSERVQGAAAAGEEQVHGGTDRQRRADTGSSQEDGEEGSAHPQTSEVVSRSLMNETRLVERRIDAS